MRLVASSHESEFNNYPEMIIFHKEVFSVYTEGVELPEFLFLQCRIESKLRRIFFFNIIHFNGVIRLKPNFLNGSLSAYFEKCRQFCEQITLDARKHPLRQFGFGLITPLMILEVARLCLLFAMG